MSPFPKINFDQTKSYSLLKQYLDEVKDISINSQFEINPQRFQEYSIALNEIIYDFSKNKVDDKVMGLLVDLANECHLKAAVKELFNPDNNINETENRAVSHTLWRDPKANSGFILEGKAKMKQISETIINGEWKGFDGKAITDIVNIGIGGSHLGPEMIVEALKPYKNHLNTHFISNIDINNLLNVIAGIDLSTTVFIIESKTFSTIETIQNAKTILALYQEKGLDTTQIQKHFIGVTQNLTEAIAFGIEKENILLTPDSVGGRFSLWSTMGISIAISSGYENFESLLSGAYTVDQHLQNTDFRHNIPVILALLGIWYNNFYKAETFAIIPYNQLLHKFCQHIQQVDMESNGKNINRNGERLSYPTGPVTWGDCGTNSQHAFFQLLHQGTHLVPIDFILVANANEQFKIHNDILIANCIAQSEALMNGKHVDKNKIHKQFDGNHPSSTLILKNLSPYNLGSLIALYEHKTFVQGVIWNIYSFDQWGVELGKTYASTIFNKIHNRENVKEHDASTINLIRQIQLWR